MRYFESFKGVSKQKVFLMIGLLCIATILPLCVNNAFVSQILFIAVFYAFLGSSWNIIGGYARQMGMGNGLFVGLGLYITTSLFVTLDISPWIGMLIAGLVTGLIGLIIGAATFRLNGSYYSLATVALLNVMRIVFNENEYIFGLFTGGAQGMRVKWIGGAQYMEFVSKNAYYFITLILLTLLLLYTYAMSRSKEGYYLKAIGTNEMAAGTLGINVFAYKMRAQFRTAFLMAMGGGIYGMYIIYMDPQTIFSFQMSFQIVLVCVFGGRGTVFGPTIGALILMPIYEILRMEFSMMLPGLPTALFGLTLMVCMQFMPNGIVPLVTNLRRRAQFKRSDPGVMGDSIKSQPE